MYTPAHFAASEEAIEALLRNSGAANLVTMTPDGLLATLLPFIYDPSVGDHGALQTHMARNNPQWSTPVTGEALMILQGPDAYISLLVRLQGRAWTGGSHVELLHRPRLRPAGDP